MVMAHHSQKATCYPWLLLETSPARTNDTSKKQLLCVARRTSPVGASGSDEATAVERAAPAGASGRAPYIANRRRSRRSAKAVQVQEAGHARADIAAGALVQEDDRPGRRTSEIW